MSSEALTPADAREAAEIIAGAMGRTVEIRGGGTRRAYGGNTAGGDIVLSTARLNGVIDYDPQELVLTVGAGAKLADIEALLAAKGQMLGFEPADLGPVFGEPAGQTTIGGILATNLSGPRRILTGAARDHFLGFAGVNGQGVAFKAGGKVVKNVTGFDLPKLMAGSWGTLALLTEVTLKVMPRPRAAATLLAHGLSPDQAIAAMTCAMSLPLAISGAAHQPGQTAFRLEGFGPSVEARLERLKSELASFGELEVRNETFTQTFWRDLARLEFAGAEGDLWRVSTAPAEGARAIAAAEDLRVMGMEIDWRMDWAGGLVWLRTPAGVALRIEGARRVRGEGAMPPSVLEPRDVLSARVRAAFDPAGVFLDRVLLP